MTEEFLQEQWYVAALSREISTNETLFGCIGVDWTLFPDKFFLECTHYRLSSGSKVKVFFQPPIFSLDYGVFFRSVLTL